jgi:hydrogenase small subunit
MSFLNADEPNVVDLIVDFGLEVIWHPSLGLELGNQAQKIFRD